MKNELKVSNYNVNVERKATRWLVFQIKLQH